jgi:hypothetical protein
MKPREKKYCILKNTMKAHQYECTKNKQKTTTKKKNNEKQVNE